MDDWIAHHRFIFNLYLSNMITEAHDCLHRLEPTDTEPTCSERVLGNWDLKYGISNLEQSSTGDLSVILSSDTWILRVTKRAVGLEDFFAFSFWNSAPFFTGNICSFSGVYPILVGCNPCRLGVIFGHLYFDVKRCPPNRTQVIPLTGRLGWWISYSIFRIVVSHLVCLYEDRFLFVSFQMSASFAVRRHVRWTWDMPIP